MEQREAANTDPAVGDHDDRALAEIIGQVVEVREHDVRLIDAASKRGVRRSRCRR
jgi:hypothetical protein